MQCIITIWNTFKITKYYLKIQLKLARGQSSVVVVVLYISTSTTRHTIFFCSLPNNKQKK